MEYITPEEVMQMDIDRAQASLREEILHNKLKAIKHEKVVETIEMLRAIMDSINYDKSSNKDAITFLEDIDPDSLKFVINQAITILEENK